MREWGVEDVCAWLRENDLSEYAHAFTAHAVDGRTLTTLTDNDLEHKLGVGEAYWPNNWLVYDFVEFI